LTMITEFSWAAVLAAKRHKKHKMLRRDALCFLVDVIVVI